MYCTSISVCRFPDASVHWSIRLGSTRNPLYSSLPWISLKPVYASIAKCSNFLQMSCIVCINQTELVTNKFRLLNIPCMTSQSLLSTSNSISLVNSLGLINLSQPLNLSLKMSGTYHDRNTCTDMIKSLYKTTVFLPNHKSFLSAQFYDISILPSAKLPPPQ